MIAQHRDKSRASVGLAIACVLFGTGAIAQDVRTIPLPADHSYPEGIAFDPAGYVFTASAADGRVVRTSLRDGSSTMLVRPNVLLAQDRAAFPRMLGMKVDSKQRLWIMGGRTGHLFVLDTRTGLLIKKLSVPGTGSVLNDAVVTPKAVYVTDTLRPILWRVPLNGNVIGEPEAWLNFAGTPIEYSDGLNLNGIAINAKGTALVVVQMDKGLLFRIDLQTKAISPVDVGHAALSGGDGLVLDGSQLFLVRQPEAEVVTLNLTPDLRSGTIVSRLKHPALRWPATAVKVGAELLIVNSQFDKQTADNPAKPFTITGIPISALQPKP